MSHRDNLDRVRQKIRELILQFQDQQGYDTVWHADNLRTFVRAAVVVAPASADRVLRDLRDRGELNYVNLDRRKSLYQFLRLDQQPEPPPAPPPPAPPRPMPPGQASLFDPEYDNIWAL